LEKNTIILSTIAHRLGKGHALELGAQHGGDHGIQLPLELQLFDAFEALRDERLHL
jgi:hypothetical protein